ncbi:Rha family transcriptional regulator [Secundilactobacillus kimchicus]|uniref:Rha family transcriptional regulator n=1 Tax=Secundilactobacillus kimchicus TaxID=528209 RepID=UPI0024A9DDA1|nr:Rha family transcriptional regulator [Secundilactobacillus kimchicus]
MQDLVMLKDKQAVTTSLQVAKTFEKNHRDILKAINNLLRGMRNSAQTQQMFAKDTYVNDQNGQEYPMYYMNRDGFTLLAMGFTGQKALDFKLKYIEAFNAMETTLKKMPVKKLDPTLQAELAIANSKSRTANALYRIAMKTNSVSAQQALLAKAAEAITGEMTIPIQNQKEYSAGEVGQRLGISANMVGRIAKRIGIKADQPGQNEYGRWSNSKSKYSNKEVPQWLYTEAGIKAIKKRV